MEGEPCQSLVNLGDMLRCPVGKGKESGFAVSVSLQSGVVWPLIPCSHHSKPCSLHPLGVLVLFLMVFLIFVVVFKAWSQYIVCSSLELTVLPRAEIEASVPSLNSALLFLRLTELNFCFVCLFLDAC